MELYLEDPNQISSTEISAAAARATASGAIVPVLMGSALHDMATNSGAAVSLGLADGVDRRSRAVAKCSYTSAAFSKWSTSATAAECCQEEATSHHHRARIQGTSRIWCYCVCECVSAVGYT